jgi:hypothetical protein
LALGEAESALIGSIDEWRARATFDLSLFSERVLLVGAFAADIEALHVE